MTTKSVTTRRKTNQAYLDARQGERQQLWCYLKRIQIIMQRGRQRWKLEDKCVLVRLEMQPTTVSKYSIPWELDPILEALKNRCKWEKIQI